MIGSVRRDRLGCVGTKEARFCCGGGLEGLTDWIDVSRSLVLTGSGGCLVSESLIDVVTAFGASIVGEGATGSV